jgi:hypothetical protein
MLRHFPIGFGLVKKSKFLNKFLEHVIVQCEIPFGFLRSNVMEKNEKKIHDFFSFTTT